MLDQIDALRALRDSGTTARAAVRLRISQSAVSKRIAALEARVGRPVTERVGRNVRLTAEGERLLRDLGPHLVAVAECLDAAAEVPVPLLRVAAAESMIATWLAPVVLAAAAETRVRLEMHAHLGTGVMARLRAGQVDVAITCEGDGDVTLAVDLVGREALALVGAIPDTDPIRVCTLESASLTGAWIDAHLRRVVAVAGRKRRVVAEQRIESFAAAAALAEAGGLPALVPAGIARGRAAVEVGLARPVVVSTRPSARSRPAVAAFVGTVCRIGGAALRRV